jgi:hypothetical protein
MTNEPLSRALTPEEVVEEMRGIDERLPEATRVDRRGESRGRAAGAVHLPGDEDVIVDQDKEPARRLSEPKPGAPDSEGT